MSTMYHSQRNQMKAETAIHPIPTEQPFQIVGVDMMELPVTTRGNKYL